MAFDPKVSFLGEEYANPIVMASGTFGCGEVYKDLLDYRHIGGFATKAVTPLPRTGNKPQRIVETPSGMLNAIGLQNEGLDAFISEKLIKFIDCNCKIWVNVSGSSFDDYKAVVEKLSDDDRFHAFEINVSCPNVSHGGMTIGTSCHDVESLTKILKNITRKPIIVKLTPNVTNIAELAKAAENGGADALTVANTFLGMSIDINKRRPTLANITGGLSGPAIKPLSLRCVWQVRQAVKIPIAGCGGVWSGKDIIEFMMAGASIVQIGTAIFANPLAPVEMMNWVNAWAAEKGIKNLEEIVGVAHER